MRNELIGPCRAYSALLLAVFLIAGLAAPLVNAEPAAPSVLMIDDFENGLARWKAEGAGRLQLVDSPDGKGKAMMWTAETDGMGHITFQNLTRDKIDFSQYDQLVFRVKIEGKPLWNLNPIIQQAPHAYGYRALYYSIDTMHPHDQWYTFSQDLTRWENAWPDTYNTEAQEFQFEVHQLAGPQPMKIYLDDIRLMRNPLGVQQSYPGTWAILEDGSQVSHYQVQLKNQDDNPVTVRAALGPAGTIDRFDVTLPGEPLHLLSGETGVLPVRIAASSAVVKDVALGYGETAQVEITVDEAPGLVLFTDLVAGIGTSKPTHPAILCGPDRMRELQKQWNNPEARKELDRYFLGLVKQAEKALDHQPTYPPNAAMGINKDPITNGKLVEVDVPNLPFRVYQDPISGRTYSGPMYDAGILGWHGQHRENGNVARQLGMGYLVTGREEFARAAAAILSRYADVYLDMPIVAPPQASAVGSATSGAVRIGASYMSERVWLGDLAIALDCIRPAGVLDDEEVQRIGKRVFEPSANLMMDHKVGAMNLQWMIQGASLFAGISADLPAVTARALHDRHGIVRLVEVGFLEDGHWWENPSYQGVAKLIAYPVLGVAMHNGMIPWDAEKYERIMLAAYQLHGPDGRSPTLGTGGSRNLSQEDTGIQIFSRYITDPGLSWVLHNRKLRRQPYGMEDFAQFQKTTPKVPAEKTTDPNPEGTVHFPDYGGVAMRLPGTDRYCYIHYGRELTHGHRNKLSINAYGEGEWFVRNVMGGYQHNFADYLETIASSTSIMVDGRNADTDTGELLFLDSVPGAEVVSAREVGAWKDVEHERTVVLTDGPLIVIDRCLADAEHTYDWLYQSNATKLELQAPSLQQVTPEVLGASKHMAGLKPLGQLPPAEPIIWKRKGDSGLHLQLLNRGEVISFETDDAIRGNSGLVWRQQGKTVGFAAAYQPLAEGKSGDAKVTPISLKDASGKAVDIEDAQAYEVTWADKKVRIVVRYSDIKLEAKDYDAAKRVVVRFVSK